MSSGACGVVKDLVLSEEHVCVGGLGVKSAYSVDMWREVRRRWLVGGVLATVLCAVLAPRLGAPSGPLHTQYVWYAPLSYIYYSAGQRARAGWGRGARAARARVLCVSCAHACVLAPALAVVLLAVTEPDSVHHALLRGVLVSAVGGGCSWLSLAVCEDAVAPLLTAANYAASLLAAPLATLLLCGRATVPPLSSVAATVAASLPAFCAGAARGSGAGSEGGGAARGCALVLLYVECCAALGARGAVRLADLAAVLMLEVCWLALSAGACWGYARCGLLSAADARLVVLCALPRAADPGWHTFAWCAPAALSRLPAVLLPPAQALLLAALPPPCPRTRTLPAAPPQ